MKQFFSRFSRRTWIITGVVAVVLLIVIVASAGGEPVALYQTEKLQRGDLVATVGATGTVRARQSAVLNWQTTGIVERVSVNVGDRVTRNDVLASLNKQSLNQSIIMAEADLASAQTALEDLINSDTARAQAALDLDDAEEAYKKAYDYRKQLNGRITITEAYLDHGVPKVRYYKGYASEEMIADADEKLALAEAQLDDARRTYERAKNGADIAAAEARVAAAEATLNQARIIAPFNGTVTQAGSVVGDQVIAGEIAFRVDDLTHLLVDVQVSEVDINTVAVGQAATLTFDAILGSEYHGEVVEAGQAGETVQGVVNFTVTVELTNPQSCRSPDGRGAGGVHTCQWPTAAGPGGARVFIWYTE
jgi:HlyD family secretion protein